MSGLSRFEERVRRGRLQHGKKFDTSALDAVDASIKHAFETGERVEVTSTWDNGEAYVRRGRVSTTTGWRPAFLLMHRTSDVGSADLLTHRDRVTAVITA